jgi:hypothetical protein
MICHKVYTGLFPCRFKHTAFTCEKQIRSIDSRYEVKETSTYSGQKASAFMIFENMMSPNAKRLLLKF